MKAKADVDGHMVIVEFVEHDANCESRSKKRLRKGTVWNTGDLESSVQVAVR